jgi:hypothetical protein
MLEIISNGSKWAGQKLDTIEELLNVLNKYSLDPSFEQHGNFVNNNPQWIKPEAKEKYKGCTKFFGNFATYSHVFDIITDEPEVIEALTEAIKRNTETEEYKKHKKEYIEKEQRQINARKLFENGKISQQEMYAMY